MNVTLDGCCDHRAVSPDEDLHRHATENLEQADALLFGRVAYEMMEAAFRAPAPAGARPDWMEPFARTIDAAKKYLVSSALDLFGTALLLLLNGLNIASDLSQVRKVVTGQQWQHHAQGLPAALIMLAGALQILQ